MLVGAHLDRRGVYVFPSERDVDAGMDSGQPLEPWAVVFGTIDEMSFGDADLWTDQAFDAPASDAYARPGHLDAEGTLRRPDPTTLDGLSLILQALADSTEDDFDSGRWTRTVTSDAGAHAITLTLPRLLAAVARETEARSAEGDERAAAQALALAARQESGRARLRLARRALARSRDCAEAWTVLADNTADIDRAIPLYREAVAAAERTLGPEIFEQQRGRFWAVEATRAYMRARRGLAECLDTAGNFGEAVTHYDAMLALNPADDQRVRHSYLIALLGAGRTADAVALIDRFPADDSPAWLLAGALALFRCEGNSDAAHHRMDRALDSNRHLAAVLAGTRDVPESADDGAEPLPGSVEEAGQAVLWQLDAWEETPGAIEWMLARYRARGRGRRRE
jgi:tetratricopeptide (TPR) repeat protein